MATARRTLKHCHNLNHLTIKPKVKQSPYDIPVPSSPKNSKRHQQNDLENEEDDEDISDSDETDCAYLTVDSEVNLTHVSHDSDHYSHRFVKRSPLSKNNDLSKKSAHNISHNGSKIYPNLKQFSNSDKGRPLKHQGPGRMVLIAFILLLLISIYLLGKFVVQTPAMILDYQSPPKSLSAIHTDIKGNLKILSSRLKQTRNFWVTVGSSIIDVVDDSPPQPSIILALVPKDSQKTTVCLLHHLTEEISLAFGDRKVLMYDGTSVKNHSPSVVSHELENFFAELREQHTAIIHNIEKLPPESAMILHGFTDNDNAPHKRALIILTLGIDLHYDNINEDLNADMILHKLWHGYLRDVDSAAIISRIANSPVIIKPEQNYEINELCPSI